MGSNLPANKKPDLNKTTLLKGIGILLLVILVFTCLSRGLSSGGETLSQYAAENPDLAYGSTLEDDVANTGSPADILQEESPAISEEGTLPSPDLQPRQTPESAENSPERITYQPDFYYEPLSDALKEQITGISYPAEGAAEISYEDLHYVHVLHCNFDGETVEGELICNKAISQDLVEIFYELYVAEYQIEKITLIDHYGGDDEASMADNNTSCFNYRTVEGTDTLSRHALGLAIDINPLYNPYVRYGADNTQFILPEGAEAYADRTLVFPYKIDTSDLCYRLFTEHGFTWGGNWNSSKDYQHFQKALP